MRRRGLISIAAAAILCAGCAQQATTTGGVNARPAAATHRARSSAPAVPRAHPQAVEPVAGASAAATITVPRSATVSVSPPSGTSGALPKPQSIAEVRRELTASGMTASASQATLTSGGLAVAPAGVPAAVQAVISAGNQIAHLPYIWGGGHMTYEDTGYDCSGSLSYVLAAAHLLSSTMTSGQLEHWGAPGRGRWITVFANAGHTFMYVAGLRFDTVALAETGTRWSDRSADESNLSSFVVRHPAGL